ncbi:MAG: DNA repair protein RecO [Mycoplasma sp.]
MLIVTKGYLIKKSPYQDFDEIIEFINEHGLKFTCISLGSRKICSKNAYHLNFGNYIEFQFFHSEEGLSRLKKVTTLSYLPEERKLNYSLFVINEVYSQINVDSKFWYKLYQDIIFSIIQDINDYLIVLFLLISVYKNIGLSINFNGCYYCSTKNFIKTVDFDHFGVVCKSCNLKYNLKCFKKSNLIIFQQMQELNQKQLKSLNIEDIKDFIDLIKSVMFFINSNSGIFFETLKII